MYILQRLKNYHPNAHYFVTLIFIAIAVIICDQLSKHAVYQYFMSHDTNYDVTPFFAITLLFNKGVSFGFMQNFEHSNILFGVLTTIIAVCIMLYFYKHTSLLSSITFGLILGGAFGNLIDRFIFGGVLDFILLHYNAWHYPAFNIADSAVVIGVFIYIISSIRNPSD
jgi:signal peptidase II